LSPFAARVLPAILIFAGVGGCGLTDHFSQIPVPQFLRYDAPRTEPEFPDVVGMAKAQGRQLFAHAPSRIEISTPLYNGPSQPYAVCARTTDDSRQPMIFVQIMRGQFFDRRRAEPKDGCDGLDFTAVDLD
jgi:hypothetical protein